MQEWVGRVAVALDLPAELAQRHADELLDMLVDVVWQSCSYDGELDSMGISTYADALRLQRWWGTGLHGRSP